MFYYAMPRKVLLSMLSSSSTSITHSIQLLYIGTYTALMPAKCVRILLNEYRYVCTYIPMKFLCARFTFMHSSLEPASLVGKNVQNRFDNKMDLIFTFMLINKGLCLNIFFPINTCACHSSSYFLRPKKEANLFYHHNDGGLKPKTMIKTCHFLKFCISLWG